MSLLRSFLFLKTNNCYHNIAPKGAFFKLQRSVIMVGYRTKIPICQNRYFHLRQTDVRRFFVCRFIVKHYCATIKGFSLCEFERNPVVYVFK